jgi:hypothetical protein
MFAEKSFMGEAPFRFFENNKLFAAGILFAAEIPSMLLRGADEVHRLAAAACAGGSRAYSFCVIGCDVGVEVGRMIRMRSPS